MHAPDGGRSSEICRVTGAAPAACAADAGGRITLTEQADPLAALRDAVAAGVELARPGVTGAAIAARCEEVLAGSRHARRHGVPAHTMGGFWGHGLGLGWEPPWLGPACDERLEPGMCLAIDRRAARSTRTTSWSATTARSCSPSPADRGARGPPGSSRNSPALDESGAMRQSVGV